MLLPSSIQFYGFAESSNPNDVYVMSGLLKWVEQQLPMEQTRLDALNAAGLLISLQTVREHADLFRKAGIGWISISVIVWGVRTELIAPASICVANRNLLCRGLFPATAVRGQDGK